jgi:hypothetical protein
MGSIVLNLFISINFKHDIGNNNYSLNVILVEFKARS